jgi:hypothetical protein
LCLGLSARPLWRGRPATSAEGCGSRKAPLPSARPTIFSTTARGIFAFARQKAGVAHVRVRFDGEDWMDARSAEVLVGRRRYLRFWVAPAVGDCRVLTVQGLDADGNVVDELQAACFSG